MPLFLVWVLGALALAIAGLQSSASLDALFLDAAFSTGSPWYTGMISNLGVLCWTVAAVSALGGSWVAYQTLRPSAGLFLLVGAMATTVLLFDDLFQIHSALLPRLGISKLGAQFVIVLPTLLWLAIFRSELVRTRWFLLAGAIGCFVVSLAIDTGLTLQGSSSLMVEDGGKFLGVLAWALYFGITAMNIARSTIRAAMGLGLRDSPVEKVRQGASRQPLAKIDSATSNSVTQTRN